MQNIFWKYYSRLYPVVGQIYLIFFSVSGIGTGRVNSSGIGTGRIKIFKLCLKEYIFRSYHFLAKGNLYLTKHMPCEQKWVEVSEYSCKLMSEFSWTGASKCLDARGRIEVEGKNNYASSFPYCPANRMCPWKKTLYISKLL